ncbi:hypothetical protein Bbelb_018920 [Branchiostoma belcheri]|nr:hypothetical protein Bbelb_018920 [Branchiostoma belcheri]
MARRKDDSAAEKWEDKHGDGVHTITVILTAHFGDKGYHWRMPEDRPAFWPQQLPWTPALCYALVKQPWRQTGTRDGLVPIIEAAYSFYGYNNATYMRVWMSRWVPATKYVARRLTVSGSDSSPSPPSKRRHLAGS